MGLFSNRRQSGGVPSDGFYNPDTCMYGSHAIPLGEQYVCITYSVERFDGTTASVDDAACTTYACAEHAPTHREVVQALSRAGIPAA